MTKEVKKEDPVSAALRMIKQLGISYMDFDALSVYLSGMPDTLFSSVLIHGEPIHLNLLKHEKMADALQHQLTLLEHSLDKRMKGWEAQLIVTEQEIEELDGDQLDPADLQILYQKIQGFVARHKELQPIFEKALAVAWNTDRPDLIEKLSVLKERSERMIYTVFGKPRNGNQSPTGLYLLIEERLSKVFDELNDSDAAMEGLVQMGIPHPQSYKESLEKLGIFTVKDLKEKGIYSRKMLDAVVSK